MTVVYDPALFPTADLTEAPLALPSAEPLTGEILVRSKVQFKTEDAKVISGIWECEPGASRWEFVTRGELIHVVSGSMTVAEDDGEPATLVAGSVAYFPIGWKGVWTVHETLRKFYVVYKP